MLTVLVLACALAILLVPRLVDVPALDRRVSGWLRVDVSRLEAALWAPLWLAEVAATYSVFILYGLSAPGWLLFFTLRACWVSMVMLRLASGGSEARGLARVSALVWMVSGLAAHLFDPSSRFLEHLLDRVPLLLLTWRHGVRWRQR